MLSMSTRTMCDTRPAAIDLFQQIPIGELLKTCWLNGISSPPTGTRGCSIEICGPLPINRPWLVDADCALATILDPDLGLPIRLPLTENQSLGIETSAIADILCGSLIVIRIRASSTAVIPFRSGFNLCREMCHIFCKRMANRHCVGRQNLCRITGSSGEPCCKRVRWDYSGWG